MPDPLDVFVRLHAAPGKEDAVHTALLAVAAPSRAEAGCVSFHAFRSTRDTRLFFIHSVWKNEAAFESHARYGHTTTFLQTADTLLDEPRVVSRTSRIL